MMMVFMLHYNTTALVLTLNYRDRIWKFRICDVKDCKADNIEFLESVTAEHVDTRIVGVTTATGCNEGT